MVQGESFDMSSLATLVEQGKAAREREIEAMVAECRPEYRHRLLDLLKYNPGVTLCQFCRRPAGIDRTCDGCHEVTSRLNGFLRDGGTWAAYALQKALLDAGYGPPEAGWAGNHHREQQTCGFDAVKVGEKWRWIVSGSVFKVLSLFTEGFSAGPNKNHKVWHCDERRNAVMSRAEFEDGQWVKVES